MALRGFNAYFEFGKTIVGSGTITFWIRTFEPSKDGVAIIITRFKTLNSILHNGVIIDKVGGIFIAAIPNGYTASAEGYDLIGELNNDGGTEYFSYLNAVSHNKYEIDNAKGTGKLYIKSSLEAGEKDLLVTFEFKKQYKYLKGENAGSRERFNSYYTSDMAALYGLQTKTLGTGDDATTYMVVPAGTKVEINAVVSFNPFEASRNII